MTDPEGITRSIYKARLINAVARSNQTLPVPLPRHRGSQEFRFG